MAIHLSMEELGISSAIDLGELDNLTPPPMENAVSALGLKETAPDAVNDFAFLRTMKGPAI